MTAPGSGRGLILSDDLAARLMAHARAESPSEACALLGGDLATGVATSVHLTRNALASPLRFEVDPRDLVRTMLGLEAAGEGLLAIFHSHTGSPAVPSPSDIREARYPVLNLVASLSDEARPLRAWRVDEVIAHEVPLTISGTVLSPTPGGEKRPSAGG